MIKATLNINDTSYAGYNILELEQNWRNFPAINIWLKVRRFDLTLPIFVTPNHEENSLTFFQTQSNITRHVVLVHPNPDVLSQLTEGLKAAGHSVTSFKRVEEANIELNNIKEKNYPIDFVIVPTKLKVGAGYTYKNYLNHKYPNLNVLTVDKSEYRDTINMREI